MPQTSNHFFELTFSARFQQDPWDGVRDRPVDTTVMIRTLCLAPTIDVAKTYTLDYLERALPSGDLFIGNYSGLTFVSHTEIPISAVACLGSMGYTVVSPKSA